jgi:hypothetical protein
MGRPARDAFDVETRQRILDAAEEEFGRAGLAGARLTVIASRAGIQAPSILHHVALAFSKLGHALGGAMAGRGGLGARVESLTRAFEGFLASRPSIASIILRELMTPRGHGRAVLMRQIVPLLDAVEAYLGRAGVRRGLPVREAMLSVVSNGLLRAATGPLREALWGKGDSGPRLARLLFVKE